MNSSPTATVDPLSLSLGPLGYSKMLAQTALDGLARFVFEQTGYRPTGLHVSRLGFTFTVAAQHSGRISDALIANDGIAGVRVELADGTTDLRVTVEWYA